MRLLVLLFLFHLSANGFSQVENEKSVKFFDHLYSFNFTEADSLISTIDSAEESSNFNFLKAHYMRWYHLPIHNQNDSILNLYKGYLTISDGFDNANALEYTQINSALLGAEYNYNQGNYYKAFQSGSKVYDLVKNNLEHEPQQEELKLLAALYHYYYHYYKAENSVIGAMMWFFKEGDKETGLKWLEEVAKQESIVKTEALIYLSHIYLRLENNPNKAFHYAEKLHNLYPNNLKFYELLIESAIAKEQKDDKWVILANKLKTSNKIYYKKFGQTYDALLFVNFTESDAADKSSIVNSAIKFIDQNGGGPHLRSLLLKEKIHLEGGKREKEAWISELKESRLYRFKLTSI